MTNMGCVVDNYNNRAENRNTLSIISRWAVDVFVGLLEAESNKFCVATRWRRSSPGLFTDDTLQDCQQQSTGGCNQS
jgi:hypothetical protein